ncbi:hypothetical protein HBI56_197530 [Parastagonospora nodorum]|nr:hypothetical protein HBH52_207750 [Parastagonospora nodorum]KAH4114688.1 hypothetical protein HBH47_192730 [Parastagonospora nodorum]KAH4288745.1 hypothetical protein HBI02_210230 [Parastagonospora nodorum]KAH4289565.1 hypothetical protein HBI01_210540 [Parastagonospora nodorum]KAH4321904.1 hypothetical protein HBI00_208030 [Parastagonospora nodorum]
MEPCVHLPSVVCIKLRSSYDSVYQGHCCSICFTQQTSQPCKDARRLDHLFAKHPKDSSHLAISVVLVSVLHLVLGLSIPRHFSSQVHEIRNQYMHMIVLTTVKRIPPAPELFCLPAQLPAHSHSIT